MEKKEEEALIQAMEEAEKQFFRTETKPGICDDCGGRIVRKVQGCDQHGYFFGHPYCEKCGEEYCSAQSYCDVSTHPF